MEICLSRLVSTKCLSSPKEIRRCFNQQLSVLRHNTCEKRKYSHEDGISFHHIRLLHKREAIDSMYNVFHQQVTVFVFFHRRVEQPCSV